MRNIRFLLIALSLCLVQGLALSEKGPLNFRNNLPSLPKNPFKNPKKKFKSLMSLTKTKDTKEEIDRIVEPIIDAKAKAKECLEALCTLSMNRKVRKET